jgi:hypothetical protein
MYYISDQINNPVLVATARAFTPLRVPVTGGNLSEESGHLFSGSGRIVISVMKNPALVHLEITTFCPIVAGFRAGISLEKIKKFIHRMLYIRRKD